MAVVYENLCNLQLMLQAATSVGTQQQELWIIRNIAGIARQRRIPLCDLP
jgi:hypothetical protein